MDFPDFYDCSVVDLHTKINLGVIDLEPEPMI